MQIQKLGSVDLSGKYVIALDSNASPDLALKSTTYSQANAISRDNDNGHLAIYGGEAGSGAKVKINGKYTFGDVANTVQIGDNKLLVVSDSGLSYDGQPLPTLDSVQDGVQFTNGYAISRNIDYGALVAAGGISSHDGCGTITLYGKDHAQYPGEVRLGIYNGPDGENPDAKNLVVGKDSLKYGGADVALTSDISAIALSGIQKNGILFDRGYAIGRSDNFGGLVVNGGSDIGEEYSSSHDSGRITLYGKSYSGSSDMSSAVLITSGHKSDTEHYQLLVKRNAITYNGDYVVGDAFAQASLPMYGNAQDDFIAISTSSTDHEFEKPAPFTGWYTFYAKYPAGSTVGVFVSNAANKTGVIVGDIKRTYSSEGDIIISLPARRGTYIHMSTSVAPLSIYVNRFLHSYADRDVVVSSPSFSSSTRSLRKSSLSEAQGSSSIYQQALDGVREADCNVDPAKHVEDDIGTTDDMASDDVES